MEAKTEQVFPFLRLTSGLTGTPIKIVRPQMEREVRVGRDDSAACEHLQIITLQGIDDSLGITGMEIYQHSHGVCAGALVLSAMLPSLTAASMIAGSPE